MTTVSPTRRVKISIAKLLLGLAPFPFAAFIPCSLCCSGSAP